MNLEEELSIDKNWLNDDGTLDGGVSTGIGFTIAWQRGALDKDGRNGAVITDVLGACLFQLELHQSSNLACVENENALDSLRVSILHLKSIHDSRLKAQLSRSSELD